MAIINSDLGVGYIGQMLERKEKLELMLEKGYNKNSYLVGKISVSDHPIKPRKKIIVLFGLALGLLLSTLFVFLKENFSNKHVKLNYKEN
jgi:LPS O-antigen subunit length determinant protein (WzzB/FepE family)